jgi:hypothetical protein
MGAACNYNQSSAFFYAVPMHKERSSPSLTTATVVPKRIGVVLKRGRGTIQVLCSCVAMMRRRTDHAHLLCTRYSFALPTSGSHRVLSLGREASE